MAVTIGRQELAEAIRASTGGVVDTPLAGILDRQLAVATAAIEAYADIATVPEDTANQAAVMLVQRLYDWPTDANPLANSGAASLLRDYRNSVIVRIP